MRSSFKLGSSMPRLSGLSLLLVGAVLASSCDTPADPSGVPSSDVPSSNVPSADAPSSNVPSSSVQVRRSALQSAPQKFSWSSLVSSGGAPGLGQSTTSPFTTKMWNYVDGYCFISGADTGSVQHGMLETYNAGAATAYMTLDAGGNYVLTGRQGGATGSGAGAFIGATCIPWDRVDANAVPGNPEPNTDPSPVYITGSISGAANGVPPPPPSAKTGRAAHWSPSTAGEHNHGFFKAPPMPASGGFLASDKLYVYIFLVSSDLPQNIEVGFIDTNLTIHAAWWGSVNDCNGESTLCHFKGTIASAVTPGVWTKLSVTADELGLAGQTINGIRYSLHGGQAYWDDAGFTRTTACGSKKLAVTHPLTTDSATTQAKYASFQQTGHETGYAFDSSTTSYWSAYNSKAPWWIYGDLGADKPINQVELSWLSTADAAKAYEIDVCTNAHATDCAANAASANWVPVASNLPVQSPTTIRIAGTTGVVTARFVRVKTSAVNGGATLAIDNFVVCDAADGSDLSPPYVDDAVPVGAETFMGVSGGFEAPGDGWMWIVPWAGNSTTTTLAGNQWDLCQISGFSGDWPSDGTTRDVILNWPGKSLAYDADPPDGDAFPAGSGFVPGEPAGLPASATNWNVFNSAPTSSFSVGTSCVDPGLRVWSTQLSQGYGFAEYSQLLPEWYMYGASPDYPLEVNPRNSPGSDNVCWLTGYKGGFSSTSASFTPWKGELNSNGGDTFWTLQGAGISPFVSCYNIAQYGAGAFQF